MYVTRRENTHGESVQISKFVNFKSFVYFLIAGVLQKTSKTSKKNVLKSLFHNTPKDIKKIEGSISEALDGAAPKETLNFTETKRVERIYENTNAKIKPIVLPKPKKGQS